MRYINCFMVTVIFSFLVINSMNAQTTISGEITCDTTWTLAGEPYHITDNVIVLENIILIIDSGVHVYVDSSSSLIVKGTLIANGTQTQKIWFDEDTVNAKWKGIKFEDNQYTVNSSLVHCDITNSDSSGVEIISSSDINLNHCNIHHNSSYEGGGINISDSKNLEISSCQIHHNTGIFFSGTMQGGGGIKSINNKRLTISGNIFSTNKTSFLGGGIYSIRDSMTIISNNEFKFNESSGGGGIAIDEGYENVIESNDIHDNYSNCYGGGIRLKTLCDIIDNHIYNNESDYIGGGIYIEDCNTENQISNNHIYCNISKSAGGIAIYSSPEEMSNHPSITKCEIYDNTAMYGNGGGLLLSGNFSKIIDCSIFGNSATNMIGATFGNGGGLYIQGTWGDLGAGVTIKNTLIFNNTAEYKGGGVYFENVATPYNVICNFQNSTITKNQASVCGGGFYGDEFSNADFHNSIIWNNFVNTGNNGDQGYIYRDTSHFFVWNFDYNDIHYGLFTQHGICTNDSSYIYYDNILEEDPLFVNSNNDIFYLLPDSPCIDSGDPDPIYNDPDSTRSDIGALYYNHDYDIKYLHTGWNWESFPRLERTGNDTVHIKPILETFNFFNEIITIDLFNLSNHLIYDKNETPQWNNVSFPVQSSQLYKVKILPDEIRTLNLEGTKLSSSFALTDTILSAYTYHWLGYWLEESQNIVTAFDTLWQYVEKVKAEDWYYDSCSSNRSIGEATPVSWSTDNKTLAYGKGYMVWFKDQEISGFHWTASSVSEKPKKKAQSENFTFIDKPDYEVIDVIDIPEYVIEIGVFQDDICVGAVVVQDSCEQILVYSENANREEIPFTFEIVTSNRDMNNLIRNYQVFNRFTGKFENSYVVAGQQESSIIKFEDIYEPQNEKPRIKIFQLRSNYPNPFNPDTNISFTIPSEQKVKLAIYNIKGQKVKELINGNCKSGKHSIVWNGNDDNGKQVGSGLYFYKLKTDKKELVKKMLLLR